MWLADLQSESYAIGLETRMESPSCDGLMDDYAWLRSTTGLRVGEPAALGYGPVCRGVSLLSASVAKLPVHVYERLAAGGKERRPDHAVDRLLAGLAGPAVQTPQLIARLIADACLHGNGYAELRMDRSMTVLGLARLDPRHMSAPAPGESFYLYQTPNGGQRRIWWDELVHIRSHVTRDGITGYGLLALARETLGLGLAAREYGARYFSQASAPASAIKTAVKLTPQQRDNLRHEYEAMHRGLSGSHRVAILDGGVELQTLAVNPEEAQLLQLRQFEVRDVANFLGLPPHLLGDDKRTSFASLEAEAQSFLDHSLDPWLRACEVEFNAKLLGPRERQRLLIEYTRQALVRADVASRGTFYGVLVNNGIVTRNEVRAWENLNPLPGLDEPLTPLNMGPGAGDGEPGAAGEPEAAPGPDDDAAGARAAARKLAADALRRWEQRRRHVTDPAHARRLERELAEPARAVLAGILT